MTCELVSMTCEDRTALSESREEHDMRSSRDCAQRTARMRRANNTRVTRRRKRKEKEEEAAPIPRPRTCVGGRTCSLEGLLGNGLSNQDKLMVLDTCGAASKRHALFPLDGAVLPLTDGRASLSRRVAAAGGEYRLCWCPGGAQRGSQQIASLGTLRRKASDVFLCLCLKL